MISEEAIARAEDAPVSALSFYVDDGKPLPEPPRVATGLDLIAVPVLEAAKLALHDAMLVAGMSKVELGRQIGMDEKAVRRLRDPLHRSHLGQVEQALHALGRRIVVEVETEEDKGNPEGAAYSRAA